MTGNRGEGSPGGGEQLGFGMDHNLQMHELGFDAAHPVTVHLAKIASAPDCGPNIFVEVTGDKLPRHIIEIGKSHTHDNPEVLVAGWNTDEGRVQRPILPRSNTTISQAAFGTGRTGLASPDDGSGPRVLRLINKRDGEGQRLEVRTASWVTDRYEGVLRFFTD